MRMKKGVISSDTPGGPNGKTKLPPKRGFPAKRPLERTLFLLDWLADRDLQRRVQIGLNKGEAHHALKRAISFHRRGEIRDRTSDGQHHRIAALNLLAAIIIYWNSWKLGEVVARRVEAGQAPALDLLPHVSPLGWEHINLTGEYRWRSLG